MRFRALIIDDEPLARKLIANLLKSSDEVEVLGQLGTGKDAVRAINSLKPDIIFLDIRLKDMTGFDVLKRIKAKMPLVIFVTAFDQYAVEAFDIFAFDYLLKPFTEERFYRSISKVVEDFKNKKMKDSFEKRLPRVKEYIETQNKITSNRIPVPLGNRTAFVSKTDIVYIKASNYHIEIFTKNARYVLRDAMYNIMECLDPRHFVRIHRSSIVNMKYIEELIGSSFGEMDVKIKEGPRLRVSKGYRKAFLIKMGLKK
ncbi:MAG: response regulator transcription factor [Bacteroidota bacterium]